MNDSAIANKAFAIGIMGWCFFAQAVMAQVHRWVDEDGRVHYGDRPPAQVESKTVDIEKVPLSTIPPRNDPGVNTGLRPTEEHLLQEMERDRKAREKEREEQEKEKAKKQAQRVKEQEKRFQQCTTATRRYEEVRRRLSQGYTATEGIKLNAQADKYRQDMKAYCP